MKSKQELRPLQNCVDMLHAYIHTFCSTASVFTATYASVTAEGNYSFSCPLWHKGECKCGFEVHSAIFSLRKQKNEGRTVEEHTIHLHIASAAHCLQSRLTQNLSLSEMAKVYSVFCTFQLLQ